MPSAPDTPSGGGSCATSRPDPSTTPTAPPPGGGAVGVVDGSGREVAQLPPPEGVSGADGIRGFQRADPREARQPSHQHSLGCREQIITPVDGGPQRLLAREGRPAAA